MKSLHLLKSGKYVDIAGQTVSFSDADIAAIAKAYDPKIHEAPIVIGHPMTARAQANAPAFGWIKNLTADESGLHGEPGQVDAAFSELVKAGKYKKLSASFYGPGHPRSPLPKQWYLRHVGFLGAQPPVVKGLDSVAFAEGDEPTLIAEINLAEASPWVFSSLAGTLRKLREYLISKDGLETADKIMPEYQIKELFNEATRLRELPETSLSEPEVNPMDELNTISLAEQEAALAKRQQELDAREAALVTAAEAAASQDALAFAEQLVTEGRVLPIHKAGLAKILTLIPDGEPVAFAEGDAVEIPAGQFARKFLASLPVQVDFSERSRADGNDLKVVPFTRPDDTEVKPEAMALHQKILAFSEQHQVDYETAMTRVAAG